MTHSNKFPTIQRNNLNIIVPFNCTNIYYTNEDNEFEEQYEYYEHIEKFKGKGKFHLGYWKQVIVKYLNNDLQEHIYKHYDDGTQKTIQSYSIKAIQLGRNDILEECDKVQHWINTVLEYYDQKKNSILNAQTEEELIKINWNFSNDVPETQHISWRDIKNMFIK